MTLVLSQMLNSSGLSDPSQFRDLIYEGSFELDPMTKLNFTIDFEGATEIDTNSTYYLTFIFPPVDLGDFWIVVLRNESIPIYDSPLDYSNMTAPSVTIPSLVSVNQVHPYTSGDYNYTFGEGGNYGFDDNIVDEYPYRFNWIFYNNNSYPLNYSYKIFIEEDISFFATSSSSSTSSSIVNTTSDEVGSTTSAVGFSRVFLQYTLFFVVVISLRKLDRRFKNKR